MLKTAQYLAEVGAAVHWLRPGQKAPIDQNWSEAEPNTPDDLERKYRPGVNLGLRPGTPSEVGPGVYLYVLDVDLRNAKIDAALPSIQKVLGDYRKFPRVHTGSGGYHFYFTSRQQLRSKLLARGDGWEVELYGTGKNLVMPPSVHPDTGREYTWSTEPPWDALELGIEFPLPDESALDDVTRESSTPASDFENDVPPADLKGLTVYDYLARVPNEDRHYDEWLAVGAALHHQFNGDQEGLDIWDDWSSQSPKYSDREYLERKWESFAVNQKGRVPVTFRTVIDMAGGPISDRELYQDRIENAGSVDRAVDIAASAPVTNVERDVLAKVVANRVRDIAGTKPTIESVRKDIAERRRDKFETTVEEIEGFREWAYSRQDKQFIHLEKLYRYDKEQFNDYWARELEDDEDDEDTMPASRIFIRRRDTKQVHGSLYLPGGDLFPTMADAEYVNTWRNTLIEPTDGDPAPFFEHVEKLIPNKSEREIFLDFLAAVVLRPGLKVRWVPVLLGVEGNGKSLFTVLLNNLLNGENVAVPENDNLHEKFTGWALNSQIIAVEEVMAHGRIELGNRLKPYITNDHVTVRKMHHDGFKIPNRFNFIMYTNHDNALILNKTDRRYFIIQTDPEPASAGQAYFDRLYGCVKGNPGAILAELMERDLSRFEQIANGRAPRTQAHDEMAGNTLSPPAKKLQSAIDTEAPPFTLPLVIQREAHSHLETKLGSKAPTYRETAKVLEELDYEPVCFEEGKNGDRIKIDENYERVWAPKSLLAKMQAPFTRDQVRDIFTPFDNTERQRALQKAVAGLRPVRE